MKKAPKISSRSDGSSSGYLAACCGELHSKTPTHLLYIDVEEPAVLQLEVSAQMPHPVGSGDQCNTIWGKVELRRCSKKN
jgi:hypothetical protein